MEIISCVQAKEKGLNHYFTGKPCPRGHVAPRFVSSRGCSECAVEKQRKKLQDPEYCAKQSAWGKANRDKYQEYRKKHYELHKEKNQQRSRNYKARSKEHLAEYNKQYRQDNPAAFLEYNALRRSARKERTPGWLTEADRHSIRVKYLEARWMSQRTGFKHVVDHFYPLRGEHVSGLHVPANLRVIPERENGKKNNRLPKVDRVAI
jgi:hypothetical protein